MTIPAPIPALCTALMVSIGCGEGLITPLGDGSTGPDSGPADGAAGDDASPPPLAGPLRPDPMNPRYFSDGSGKAIFLTGSHIWMNLIDEDGSNPPPAFDFPGYLDFMQQHNQNFIRLWTAQHPRVNAGGALHFADPLPWLCTLAGTLASDCPRFDLAQFDVGNLTAPQIGSPHYFERLRARVVAAQQQGIYVSIMLFEGWSIQNWPGSMAWGYHPFTAANNANGVDADINGDGYGLELYTLPSDPAYAGNASAQQIIRQINQLQKNYVKQVIDTVHDLDNVLYEIINEAQLGSVPWQNDMIRYIQGYESSQYGLRHPVGMTTAANEAAILGGFQQGSFASLSSSPADWISPGQGDPERNDWMNDPPASSGASGSKVILLDTDHIWGSGGNSHWVWKSFTRGLNPIFMDIAPPLIYGSGEQVPNAEEIRSAMAQARTYANRINLERMTPHGELASTGFALANPGPSGAEYLVYLPSGGQTSVNLSAVPGTVSVEWLNPVTGQTATGAPVAGGTTQTFTAPASFSGEAVLYLKASP